MGRRREIMCLLLRIAGMGMNVEKERKYKKRVPQDKARVSKFKK